MALIIRRSEGASGLHRTLYAGRRVRLIYGAMRDKAIDESAGSSFRTRKR